MSKISIETITCPKCNKAGDFECWGSVNADLNPEAKEKIFNEELFIWTCPHCGAKVYIPFGTLYHDMKNNFMIFFSHEVPEDEDKYEPMELPDSFGMGKNYTFRKVYGLLNFKEKILILENGLNDIAVAKLKYCILNHMATDMLEKGTTLFFTGLIEPDDKNKYGKIDFFFEESKTQETGHISVPMEMYYDQCLSIELDKRFQVSGCVCIDEEWIANKMKGAE